MTFDFINAPPPAAQLQTYKPEPEDEKMVRDGLAFLVVRAPFFAHLVYNEMQIKYSRDIPVAATDARTIFFNTDGLKAIQASVSHISFITAHEVAHYFFGDLVMQLLVSDADVEDATARLEAMVTSGVIEALEDAQSTVWSQLLASEVRNFRQLDDVNGLACDVVLTVHV